MAGRSRTRTEPRTPLTRERILRAGMARADAGGLDTLTMRELAAALDTAPMSLYRHVANRDDLLDGMVDLVFAEVPLPEPGEPWLAGVRRRSIGLYEALVRHPWAIGLMESRRRPGPANLHHHDAMIGCLRGAGFDIAMTAHIYSVLDGYVYGFALTKVTLPFSSADAAAVAGEMLAPFPMDTYPHLAEMVTDRVLTPGYDFGDEFLYGLDLVLDGLARLGVLG